MQITQSAIGGPRRHLRFGAVWFCILLSMFLLGGVISWFDGSEQIAPSRDGIQNVCMAAAGAVALFPALILFRQMQNRILRTRLFVAAFIAVLGFFSSMFLFYELACLVEGWLDFPAGKTRTTEETMPITYAYLHRAGFGKGPHRDVWNIEVGDALFGIVSRDADFMLNHRLPGDTSGALGQIWSGGYFCAKLTMESAGNAKRVLHTGGRDLPEGSVILCPKASYHPG